MKIFTNGTTRVALMLAMFAMAGLAKAQAAEEATQGTIVRVEKNTVSMPEVTDAGGATDNPLQTQFYRYDIAVRVGDGIYVGRYDSASDYLPGSLAPNHVVAARLHKGVIELDSPGDSVKAIVVSHTGDARQDWDETASTKPDANETPNGSF